LADSNHSLVTLNKDGYAVISFPKELARAQLSEIREVGEKITDELSSLKIHHCLIDLSELDSMGSSLVATIVRIWKTMSEHEGRIVVIATNLGTREVLKVTGLNKIWTIASSYQEGVHALGFSKEAKVEKRERRLLVMVGAFSLLCGLIAVAFRTFEPFAGMMHPADLLVYSILGLSIVTSAISIFREQGWRLGLTIAVFLIGLPLLGFFAWLSQATTTDFPQTIDSSSDTATWSEPEKIPSSPDQDKTPALEDTQQFNSMQDERIEEKPSDQSTPPKPEIKPRKLSGPPPNDRNNSQLV
jgi:anti-anti-sigma factor